MDLEENAREKIFNSISLILPDVDSGSIFYFTKKEKNEVIKFIADRIISYNEEYNIDIHNLVFQNINYNKNNIEVFYDYWDDIVDCMLEDFIFIPLYEVTTHLRKGKVNAIISKIKN